MEEFNFNDAMKLSHCDDVCTDKGFNISNFLVMSRCEETISTETDSADILSLYKQLKLQEAIKQSDIEKGKKKSLLYTNDRLIDDITNKITYKQVNYPASYQSVSKQDISNTILTNKQLLDQHLMKDPFKH